MDIPLFLFLDTWILLKKFPQIIEQAPFMDVEALRRKEAREAIESGNESSAGEPYDPPDIPSSGQFTISPDGTIHRSENPKTDQ